jgi:hypothetical protein
VSKSRYRALWLNLKFHLNFPARLAFWHVHSRHKSAAGRGGSQSVLSRLDALVKFMFQETHGQKQKNEVGEANAAMEDYSNCPALDVVRRGLLVDCSS